VVAEAARIADDVGLDRLTLAAVAQRLGVALPSLYKHVNGLDELQRRLATRALTGLGAALSEATVGRAGGDALRHLAAAYRGYARSHPGGYASTLRAPDSGDAERIAASDAVLRTVFAVLAGYGLTGDDAIDATRCLRSGLHGFVALEAAGGFGLPRDVDRTFDRLVAMLDSTFTDWGRS
jgi:AcrR family transcriptional regulator